MGALDWLILAVVAVAAVLAVRYLVKRKGCGCGSGGCEACTKNCEGCRHQK